MERVEGTTSRYVVRPVNGTPFEITIRAAQVEGGHPGKFVVGRDGTTPAMVTLSDRAKGSIVARTVANLLHQLANAGRPTENLLRPGSDAQHNSTLSREDGGRLAEARLLAEELETTSVYRAVRRQNIRNELRALMEHLGVAHGQKDAGWRRTALDADGPLVDKLTRGWVAGDERPRTRVYVAKELVFAGVPVTAASVGIAVSDNIGGALGLGVPAIAAAVLSGFAQRWLDGHKNATKAEQYGARLGEALQRRPGALGEIESDPYGLAGKPVAELDPSALAPAKWRYRLRHLGPSIAGAGVATALSGGFTLAPTLFFAASAVIRPLTERFGDGRRNKLEVLRFEEWITRVATDPQGYENELLAFLSRLGGRLNEATTALSRVSQEPGSLGYGTILTTESLEQIPGIVRRAVPGKPNPTETDPNELSRQISSYAESLIFGALSSLSGALAAAGVNTVIQRQSDQAVDELFRHNLDLVASAESQALYEAVQTHIAKLVDLVDLTERLATTPPHTKLSARTLARFRDAHPPTPGVPLSDDSQEPAGTVPFWAQALTTIPPLVTLGVVNLVDVVLGMDPVTYTATVFAATATLFTAPVARWLANREDIKHGRHAMDTNNERAIDQQRLAGKVGALLFLNDLRASQLRAQLEAAQTQAAQTQAAQAQGPQTASPTPAPTAMNIARAVDLLFAAPPTSADFTNRVRAAVRAARLTIHANPGERTGLHERHDRHLSLDAIEQHADRVDEAADQVLRGDPGAEPVLRAARTALADAVRAHAAETTDGRGALPDLATVDPATGARITGDPLTRAQAAADEARRRLLAEPDHTPLRGKRQQSLDRVRSLLDVLAKELSRGDRARVKYTWARLILAAPALRGLQRRAHVAGDPEILTDQLRTQIEAFLDRPDGPSGPTGSSRSRGNAAKLGEFVADGTVQDHVALTERVVRALRDSGLASYAGVYSVEPLGDGATVEVTTLEGEVIVVRFEVGTVPDGHPAEYELTGGPEYAEVRVSDRIKNDDLIRAIVHEIRELSRLSAPDHAFTPHEQGRIGELLYLDQDLAMAEHFDGHDPARRRVYQQKMRELYDELRLSDPARRAQLEPAVEEVVQRNEVAVAAALAPLSVQVRLSEEQRVIHIIPRHGYGTAAEGTKFHRDFELDTLEALSQAVVARAPIPVERDDFGNAAHEFDFGPGVVIGESGTAKVRVWIDTAGNVRTVHPVDKS